MFSLSTIIRVRAVRSGYKKGVIRWSRVASGHCGSRIRLSIIITIALKKSSGFLKNIPALEVSGRRDPTYSVKRPPGALKIKAWLAFSAPGVFVPFHLQKGEFL
jgi:hypothetical protein